MNPMTVLGLMSGTSMDGVDAAVLVTDGEGIAGRGPTYFRQYGEDERQVLREALKAARDLTDRRSRRGALAEAERTVTDAHAEAVARLLRDNPTLTIDLVGFHGQTVLHAPDRKLTVQIGDGAALAKHLGVPVVYDFRAADVAAGGQGAPLVPVYHQALVRDARLAGTVAVVNIGGVANVTRVGADGSLTAGDTGPGNALLDDLVRARTGAAMDVGGILAASGIVDEAILAALIAHPWFDRPMPKSLDRNAFAGAAAAVAALSDADGAATLAMFTARSLAKGIAMAGGADRVVVAGGGAQNPTLMLMIAGATGLPVGDAEACGWSSAFLEAEAFAYLAARSRRGLPLTFPGTTGVPAPMTGGVLARA